ncbi:hotdog fold thioesterase [Sodalis glossinidius]|uniref:hotdog fold thioesterase n=1 Tax=Sodalis glossinidius TaxID=63612 RepID=UPI0014122F74|nr:hotdog fold thioesterase [Sodalis glossinidius]
MIWTRTPSLERLNQIAQGCMIGYLGIRYTRLEEDELEAVMPVDERTRQPFGILHSGVSVVLAETVGSAAGYLCTHEDQRIVGLDINANHLHSVYDGWVRAVCRPFHLGRTRKVWDIHIFNDTARLTCVSRLTTAVLDGPNG